MGSLVTGILPELICLTWVITLFYRVNRRLKRIEQHIGLNHTGPARS
jgi:sorbitol-specific phosphotransferase system component IIC